MDYQTVLIIIIINETYDDVIIIILTMAAEYAGKVFVPGNSYLGLCNINNDDVIIIMMM